MGVRRAVVEYGRERLIAIGERGRCAEYNIAKQMIPERKIPSASGKGVVPKPQKWCRPWVERRHQISRSRITCSIELSRAKYGSEKFVVKIPE